MLPLLLLLLPQDSLAARAESLIAAHDLRAARHIAEQLVSRHPADAAAHLLLGRVLYAWPVVGRYAALAQFREAARLDPHDPEPLYWQVRVGEYLGSDDGEGIIREAILRIFELVPDYADCWTLFTQLYQDDGTRRRADAALARYPDDVGALERRARLAIALQEPERADSLAALVLARRGRYVAGFLLRAEAGFDAHRDDQGYAWYDSALAAADADSTGALWSELWTIASPTETDRYSALAPGERRGFLTAFWSRRDPNLVTPQNERIAEHFRRMAEVRRMFQLLHPYTRFQRSAAARALEASYLNDAVLAALRSGVEPLDSLSPARLLLPDLREFTDTAAHLTSYARANLSAPGLIWLRHGRPDLWEREQGWLTASHAWTYYTSDGPLTITFSGIPGPLGAHGDYIVAPPLTARSARQVHELLTTDGTSLPARLTARGWIAFYRNADSGATQVYVRTAPESAAVVLWDSSGSEVARAAGSGLLALSASPGLYALGLDVDSAGQVGRERGPLTLPRYAGNTLTLSSLALAPGDSLGGREATLTGMPADLAYPAGQPFAAYAEVYGLTRDADERARYHVRYSFTPVAGVWRRLTGGVTSVVFEFDRDVGWRDATPERLVIAPGRLEPGRYRVTLSVTDVPTNVKSETVALEIAVR